MTKNYKTKYILCRVVSEILTICPVLIYFVKSLIEGSNVQKFCLCITLLVAIMLVVLNFLMKRHIRSTLWILILGIHICIRNITPLLIIIAVATILDEFVFDPMAKKYKNLFVINKEIDKRK